MSPLPSLPSAPLPSRTIHNFAPGPAMLPREVLEQAQAELLSWNGCGMSVMEISHRSKEFVSLLSEIDHNVRSLLQVPDHYRVMFLQGGGTLQFSMVPLNLLRGHASIDWIDSGHWAQQAQKEAQRMGARVRVLASGEPFGYRALLPVAQWLERDPHAGYCYYVSNETIGGLAVPPPPNEGTVPLVCDMSSDLFSRPVPVADYGLIYAAAQKNFGPAGLTLVLLREDLLRHAPPDTPRLLDYETYAEHQSLYNTPPTFALYLAGLTFQWMLREGGMRAMESRSRTRAALLYQAIDESSGFYSGMVEPEFRSRMNITFRLPTPEQDAAFIAAATQEGLFNLKGHRVQGGIRASLYNAMPLAGVEALVGLMKEFARRG